MFYGNLIVRIYDKILCLIEKKRIKSITFGKKGDGVKIGKNNRFYASKNIYIDNYVHVGNENYFYADAPIIISNGTVISDRCEIRTANHYYDGDDLRFLPYDERVICKQITIERNCWIGARVIILPGVTIHEGAVVGAGSVISEDIPNNAVVCGNPAKIIKYRNKEVYNKLSKENKQIVKIYDSYIREKIMEERKND